MGLTGKVGEAEGREERWTDQQHVDLPSDHPLLTTLYLEALSAGTSYSRRLRSCTRLTKNSLQSLPPHIESSQGHHNPYIEAGIPRQALRQAPHSRLR